MKAAFTEGRVSYHNKLDISITAIGCTYMYRKKTMNVARMARIQIHGIPFVVVFPQKLFEALHNVICLEITSLTNNN